MTCPDRRVHAAHPAARARPSAENDESRPVDERSALAGQPALSTGDQPIQASSNITVVVTPSFRPWTFLADAMVSIVLS